MTRVRRIAAVAVVALLGLGTAATTCAAQAAPTVKMRESSYGRIVVDGRGLTLYAFTRDGRGPSRCYGRCATAWPPLLASGELRAGTGIRRGLLGTTRRRDGTRQVTLRGRPLYFYFRERRPGEIFCQNVDEFGGTWLLMSPRGALIR
jgi:predicted lipoprotein with Yx(FWY)xxD motif